MSKITKGDLVMLINFDVKENKGAIGTVCSFSNELSKKYKKIIWMVKFCRPVIAFCKGEFFSTENLVGVSEDKLIRICPPPSEITPDPVEAPVDEVPA